MMSLSSDGEQPGRWVSDPAVMLFSSGYRSPVGVSEDHGLRDRAEQLLAKSTEEVKASWLQAVEQMRLLIAGAENLAGDYELSEIEFKLGFTAAGTVVFIAQAGIEATISATFKRREGAADQPDPRAAAAAGVNPKLDSDAPSGAAG
jgi:hypothetical protein